MLIVLFIFTLKIRESNPSVTKALNRQIANMLSEILVPYYIQMRNRN